MQSTLTKMSTNITSEIKSTELLANLTSRPTLYTKKTSQQKTSVQTDMQSIVTEMSANITSKSKFTSRLTLYTCYFSSKINNHKY